LKINHIGITVSDIDAAVDWYCSTFDLTVLVPVHDATTQTDGAARRRDVFGKQWRHMKLAHLADREGVGFELFEFVEPPVIPTEDGFDYWSIGVSHIALTVEDLPATVDRIITGGGRTRSEVHELPSRVRICYCSDPWGTTIELVTDSYGEMLS
jgi:catechol 2,3-dioxygenase-like lactoylglutathione lyase family enzyme